jgi:hypothetical protein
MGVVDVEDGFGYSVSTRDLEFLTIREEDVRALTDKSCPLGMTLDMFDDFVATLREAAYADGLMDCEARLRGSSAEFFSGHHKFMVWDRAEVLDLFREEHRRLPRPPEFSRVYETLIAQWPDDRPRRRPFDALYVTRISPDPSDYDVQISSDDLRNKVEAQISELGLDPSDAVVKSETYGFFRKDLVHGACPNLVMWMAEQRAILRRNVTIAGFRAAGPRNTEATAGPLSAHHRPTDWVIVRRPPGRGQGE